MKDDVDGVKKNKFLHKLGTVFFASGTRWFDIKRVLLSYKKNDAQFLDIMHFPAAIQQLRGNKNILLLYSGRKCSTNPLYQENKVSVSMEFKTFYYLWH